MHPIALWLHTGRDSDHQSWEPIAKCTEVPYLDVARAEVIHRLQVPHHQEKHHSLHQHPEEAGEEEVVKKSCNEGTAHLQRSRLIRTVHPGRSREREQGTDYFDWIFPNHGPFTHSTNTSSSIRWFIIRSRPFLDSVTLVLLVYN